MLSKFDTRPNSIWRSRFRSQNDRRMYSKLTYSRVIQTDRSIQQLAGKHVLIPNIGSICQDFASDRLQFTPLGPSGTAGGEVNISKHLGLAIDSAILLFYVHAAVTSTHYILMHKHKTGPQLGNSARSLSHRPPTTEREKQTSNIFVVSVANCIS